MFRGAIYKTQTDTVCRSSTLTSCVCRLNDSKHCSFDEGDQMFIMWAYVAQYDCS